MENDLELLAKFRQIFEDNDVEVIMHDGPPTFIYEDKHYMVMTRRLASFEDITDKDIREEITNIVKEEKLKSIFLYTANKYPVTLVETNEIRNMLTFRFCKKETYE